MIIDKKPDCIGAFLPDDSRRVQESCSNEDTTLGQFHCCEYQKYSRPELAQPPMCFICGKPDVVAFLKHPEFPTKASLFATCNSCAKNLLSTELGRVICKTAENVLDTTPSKMILEYVDGAA